MPQAAGACGGGRGYGEGAGARWSRSVGRGHDQLRFSLADALAREEPGVRLGGIAELAERAVQLGRARVHLEDREDAPVALDEGDVERGGGGLPAGNGVNHRLLTERAAGPRGSYRR